MKKQKAIDKLQRQIDLVEPLKQKKIFSSEFKKWERDTEIAIEYIFEKSGRHKGEFTKIRYSPWICSGSTPDHIYSEAYHKGLDVAGVILKSMVDEIKEYGTEEDDTFSETDSAVPQDFSDSREVFIVHGHDEAAKESVARFIDKLGLKPIILHEQANKSRTIIEKFESHSDVAFAVVLMTPDDVGASAKKPNETKSRARQNVILELGFFLGKLGRDRVCALYKSDVETPSDFDGVLYVPMDAGNGWQLQLAKEIRAAGIAIDMNNAI